MNRRERRAQQYAERRELFQALEAAFDANAILVVDWIIGQHKLNLCPCCLIRPVFERNPDGSPVEDHGQRVLVHTMFCAKGNDEVVAFWICETCAVSYTSMRSRTMAVPFNLGLWIAREAVEARRQEIKQEIRQRFGAPSGRGG